MIYKYFILAAVLCFFTACKQEMHLTKIEGVRTDINDSISGDKAIEDFIKPFREHVNKTLDSVLAYSADTYTKNDGDLNTAIGNFMADAVLELSNPIFKSRTGNDIDIVILNHGGIRSILSKGDVTARTAYQIMPFDNIAVVTALEGRYVKDMVTYLQRAKQAHPISGISIRLDADYELVEALVGGEAH